jgi:hypothetical protein
MRTTQCCILRNCFYDSGGVLSSKKRGGLVVADENTKFVYLLSLDINYIVSQIQLFGSGVVYLHTNQYLRPLFPGAIVGKRVETLTILTLWERKRMAPPYAIHGCLVGLCTDWGLGPLDVLYQAVQIPSSDDMVFWGQVIVGPGQLTREFMEHAAIEVVQQIHLPEK